eukprot:m.136291 g.136291  ORF g.136291 m.136291 type:complete len:208 (+) comp10587_c0_seq1:262-885(+)
MAQGRMCTRVVYVCFILLGLTMVGVSFSLPTWFLSDTSNGACGPFAYTTDKSQFNDIQVWDKMLKDNPVPVWFYSSVCLLLACIVLLLSAIFVSFQTCLPICFLGLTRFLLLFCVVLEVASACLFASGLGQATVDANDDAINQAVFDTCPCETSGSFQTGSCGVGAGNLLVGAGVVVTFVATMIGFLTHSSSIAKIYPFNEDDDIFN